MEYTPTVYVNDNPPALNADNLNKSEQGIKEAHEGIVKLNGAINEKADNYKIKFFEKTNVSSRGVVQANNSSDLYVCKLYGANVITKYKTNNTSVVYAFYEDEPVLGSISYNSSRVVLANTSEITDLSVPSGCEWVAFSVATGNDIEIILPDENTRMNIIETEISSQGDTINTLYDDIYYAFPVGEQRASYLNGDIGSAYTETVSSTWRSVKVEANAGEKFKCVFTPKMSVTTSFDWILFVNSNNIIIDKVSGNYKDLDSKTMYVSCPNNTSYILVNAFKYQDVVNLEVYPETNAITEIQDIIAENKNDNGYISKGEILLPKIIDVAVGRQCNLNWCNIANIRDKDTSVYFEVICDIGAETERGFVIQPDSTMVGSHTIKINVRDSYSRKVINTYSGTVRIVNNSSLATVKNMLMIGDSRTTLSGDGVQGESFAENNNRMVTTETKSLLDSAYSGQIHFIGTYYSPLDLSVRNLAVSGWNLKNVNDTIDDAGGIVNYVEDECGLGSGASLDVVTFMLGINDIGPWRGDSENIFNTAITKIPTYIARAKTLIDSILSGYPNCNIIVILESTICANQDGFGYFSDSRYRRTARDEAEQALKVLRKEIISTFDDSAYSNKVIISTAGIWCDRLYGFPYIMEHPFARASVKEVERFVNFLHPHNDGYKQIADGVYSSVVGLYQ